MTALLKSFAKGLLYLLVLPFGIVILSVYAVIGVGMFIYIGIKSAILFFTGRNLGELDEDTKARLILEKQKRDTVDIFDESQNQNVNVQEELKNKISNDFVSNYYVPLDSSVPAPNQNVEEKKEEVPPLEHPDLGGDDHA